MKQQTLRRKVQLEGVGLQTGRKQKVVLHPEREGAGIRFDIGEYSIPAHFDYIISTTPSVTLGLNGVRVKTVEHLLSVLYGLEIHNVRIEVFGDEIPENTKGFCKLLEEEVEEQSKVSCSYHFQTSNYSSEDRNIQTFPSYRFTVSCLYTPEFLVGVDQLYALEVTPENYSKELSWARTFCTENYLRKLRLRGYAQGVSEDNCIIMKNGDLGGERELVRHKVLDFIGDISLTGLPVTGHFILTNPSHEFTREYLTAIFRREDYGLSKDCQQYRYTYSSNGRSSKDRERLQDSEYCEI